MKFLTALLPALILGATVHAAPSQSSFEELLQVTNTQAKLDAMAQRLDNELTGIFSRQLGEGETPEQAAYTMKFRLNVKANFQKEFTLESLAASYLKDGHGDLTQEEVDALNALAKNPAGRSALAKLAGTQRAVEILTLKRIALFTKEPAQSLETAMKALQEMKTKTPAVPPATPATTPPGGQSAAATAAPHQVELPKSK